MLFCCVILEMVGSVTKLKIYFGDVQLFLCINSAGSLRHWVRPFFNPSGKLIKCCCIITFYEYHILLELFLHIMKFQYASYTGYTI